MAVLQRKCFLPTDAAESIQKKVKYLTNIYILAKNVLVYLCICVQCCRIVWGLIRQRLCL